SDSFGNYSIDNNLKAGPGMSDELFAIKLKNYSYQYASGKTALSSISLGIKESEHTVIIGPNGSGKSTLLRSIVGILRGNGEIRVFGELVKKRNLRHIRKNVGYLFQDPQVQLFCPTVIEDVAFGPLNYHGDELKALSEAGDALTTVGYAGAPETSIHSLSLGEMRKVALAGILAVQPKILLLDEPDAFLDESGKKSLVEILSALENVTIILVTHDRNFAAAFCKRAIHLESGEITSEEYLQ
ncbi:MAG: ATP-binding cassette domain-containing protein, partial [Candidatus Marinimicrobia bacterium]|nr:ATP-binding cassette domain-containing protein [Candidatus Neomarinimicrobiota bacterium]